jgi:hypothetical protein
VDYIPRLGGGDMDIIKGLKLSRLILVISVVLVSLSTVPSKGYGDDDWVYVGKNDNFSFYYNNTNINLDRESKQIKVWVKTKFTPKGVEWGINKRKELGLSIKNYGKVSKRLTLILFDYGNLQSKMLSYVDYSVSGDILESNDDSRFKSTHIIPGSISDDILNKLLKDYNIPR